jgi:hypothetical protein
MSKNIFFDNFSNYQYNNYSYNNKFSDSPIQLSQIYHDSINFDNNSFNSDSKAETEVDSYDSNSKENSGFLRKRNFDKVLSECNELFFNRNKDFLSNQKKTNNKMNSIKSLKNKEIYEENKENINNNLSFAEILKLSKNELRIIDKEERDKKRNNKIYIKHKNTFNNINNSKSLYENNSDDLFTINRMLSF